MYIDNLLIASPDAEEHKKHLHLVFEHPQSHGVLINSAKCELGVHQLQFQVHQIDSQGIHPLPDKVRVHHGISTSQKCMQVTGIPWVG